MCGLEARRVREELVRGAAREAGPGFVYGEIKPRASVGFFAALASTGVLPPSLCRPGGSYGLPGFFHWPWRGAGSWVPGCHALSRSRLTSHPQYGQDARTHPFVQTMS